MALRISDLLKLTWADVLNGNKNNLNTASIMETLNHSSLNMTKRYLGIRQDEINDLYVSWNL